MKCFRCGNWPCSCEDGICLVHLDSLEIPIDVRCHSVVTDPPYGLKFMGKQWDHGVPGVPFWNVAKRCLYPGGHVLAFGGTRTYHRLACAIEDAGFDIRDQVDWVYGSGWPKNHDIGKKSEEWAGWGTALKPAHEPICMARKPLEGTVVKNVLKYGTGGINVDGCRVETSENLNGGAYSSTGNRTDIPGACRSSSAAGMMAHGKTVGKEFVQPEGRFPANLIHDGSEEVVDLFPITSSGAMKRNVSSYEGNSVTGFLRGESGPHNQHGDSGSAARFFYCAKASKKERGKNNNHPTVKPLELMKYLVRLVTPPNGTILDMFCGSGTTLLAAREEGFKAIGFDDNEEYCQIAAERLGADFVKK